MSGAPDHHAVVPAYRGQLQPGGDPVAVAIQAAFREDRGAVLATLIRRVGDFQLAEDAVQDAFESALSA